MISVSQTFPCPFPLSLTPKIFAVQSMSDDVEYRCFIGGLSWSTSDRGLKDAFEKFGHLLEAKVSACFMLNILSFPGCFHLLSFIFDMISSHIFCFFSFLSIFMHLPFTLDNADLGHIVLVFG